MTLSQARRAAVLAQVQMVGPIILDAFGFKRLRFNTGASTGQVENAIEQLTRTGELRVRVVAGQVIVSAIGGAE